MLQFSSPLARCKISLTRRQNSGLRRAKFGYPCFYSPVAGKIGLSGGDHKAEEYRVFLLQDETVWPDSGGFLSCFRP